MNRELIAKLAVHIPCPSCGAEPGEQCELGSGQPRSEPHRDRIWSASDELEAMTRLRDVQVRILDRQPKP